MARMGIIGITPDERDDIRHAVHQALRYWPNDGGDETPRENIRRAFRMLRQDFMRWQTMQAAAVRLEQDAYRYRNM